jgi:hypothetical protein
VLVHDSLDLVGPKRVAASAGEEHAPGTASLGGDEGSPRHGREEGCGREEAESDGGDVGRKEG